MSLNPAYHPRFVELLTHLDTHRAALLAALECVPEGARDRRPGPTAWSVAEVLEHLGIVEARITGLIQKQVADARASGLRVESETSSVLGTFDVDQLLDRSLRIVAGDVMRPTGQIAWAEAWSRLEAQRAGLRQVVVGADGLAIGDLSAPHARLGQLNLYQWVLFIGAHEGRHALQIREIGRALAGPDSTPQR